MSQNVKIYIQEESDPQLRMGVPDHNMAHYSVL